MKRRQMLFGVGVVVMLAALFTWNFSRENRIGTSSLVLVKQQLQPVYRQVEIYLGTSSLLITLPSRAT